MKTESRCACVVHSQIDNIFSVCVYCNRSQMTSQRVRNKEVRVVRHETKSSGMTVVLYTL